MKKVLLVLLVVVSGFTVASAQKNAIGLRLGGGAEATYQREFSERNRLEANLGIDFWGGFELTGLYQWVWDLSALAPGFKWYAGVGAGIAAWGGFDLGVRGDIGIEYNFKFPLQLSLDYQPGLYFLQGVHYYPYGFGISARYKF